MIGWTFYPTPRGYAINAWLWAPWLALMADARSKQRLLV